MRKFLLCLSVVAGAECAAAPTPPSDEIAEWAGYSLQSTGGGGAFLFSDAAWNQSGSFPLSSAAVLFSQKYGADFGHAVTHALVPIGGGCPLDQDHYDGIWDEFVTFVTTGEIKTLLSDAEALSLQLNVLADATGPQEAFAATGEFSIEIAGEYLVTTGIEVSGTAANSAEPVEPDAGSWDEATANAAAAVAQADADVQFHPIEGLSGARFSSNASMLREYLAGYAGVRVEPVFTAWGTNSSRLFTRVVMDEKYMIVDTDLGLAHGPYALEPLEQPFVGDALAPYVSNFTAEYVAVMAVLTPCNTPGWNPGTTPKPAWWPTMPAWPTKPAPAAPGTLDWQCQSEGGGQSCRCQLTRSVSCNCTLWIFCDTCRETVECVWFPGADPNAPATCGPGTGFPSPPGGNSFCDEYWRY